MGSGIITKHANAVAMEKNSYHSDVSYRLSILGSNIKTALEILNEREWDGDSEKLLAETVKSLSTQTSDIVQAYRNIDPCILP